MKAVIKNTKSMGPYMIYQDSRGILYVKGDIGGGYTINYNDGSHWDYCLEKESDIISKTVNTGEFIKLKDYPCDMTKILSIENELDANSLAFIHKIDTFSKIPRLQMLRKTKKELPEAVEYVLNLGEHLKNNLYLSEICLSAVDSLRNFLDEIRSGKTNPQKDYNLTFDEYYLFNQIVNDYHLLYKIGDAARIIRSNDPDKDEWHKVCDVLEESERN